MTTAATSRIIPSREGEEVWESTVPGRVHVAVTNHLGRVADVTAAGTGSRIRISTLDRQLAEEQCRDLEVNPFRNGMLFKIAGPDQEGDTSNVLNDEAMIEVFNLKPQEFEKILGDLSELNVRRLKAMSVPADAAASQIRTLDELIELKWKVGNSTPTYDDMMTGPK